MSILDVFFSLFIPFQIGLFLLSYSKIRNSKDTFGFIYPWGWVFGAFVWEDLLLFSLFTTIFSSIIFVLHDVRYGFIFYSIFWIVRTAGEALYFFLQQFNQPLHHPHDISWHFTFLKKLFGPISNQKCFVIMQVFFQVILATCLIILVVSLKFWNQIPIWF